jgi:hypothetical protein
MSDFDESVKGVLAQLDMLIEPYSCFGIHLLSFTYPFFHLLHCVQNLVSLFMGGVALVHSVFDSKVSTRQSAKVILLEIGSFTFNLIHVGLSVISLASRTLSTLLNLGYPKESRRMDLFFSSSLCFAELATLKKMDEYLLDVACSLETGVRW